MCWLKEQEQQVTEAENSLLRQENLPCCLGTKETNHLSKEGTNSWPRKPGLLSPAPTQCSDWPGLGVCWKGLHCTGVNAEWLANCQHHKVSLGCTQSMRLAPGSNVGTSRQGSGSTTPQLQLGSATVREMCWQDKDPSCTQAFVSICCVSCQEQKGLVE